MDELKDIAREMIKIRKELKLDKLSDDALMDCSVRIFNTHIMNDKHPKIQSPKEPATKNQIGFLKTRNIKISEGLTKMEAHQMISKIKEKDSK